MSISDESTGTIAENSSDLDYDSNQTLTDGNYQDIELEEPTAETKVYHQFQMLSQAHQDLDRSSIVTQSDGMENLVSRTHSDDFYNADKECDSSESFIEAGSDGYGEAGYLNPVEQRKFESSVGGIAGSSSLIMGYDVELGNSSNGSLPLPPTFENVCPSPESLPFSWLESPSDDISDWIQTQGRTHNSTEQQTLNGEFSVIRHTFEIHSDSQETTQNLFVSQSISSDIFTPHILSNTGPSFFLPPPGQMAHHIEESSLRRSRRLENFSSSCTRYGPSPFTDITIEMEEVLDEFSEQEEPSDDFDQELFYGPSDDDKENEDLERSTGPWAPGSGN